MNTFNIDPGNTHSALVVFHPQTARITAHAYLPNSEVLERITHSRRLLECEDVIIEMIASYGMAVGREVFETCLWIGRFCERADAAKMRVHLVYRRDVKMALCGNNAAKDANIRQALMDKYGATKAEVIGTKKSPGPLYGITGDEWAALGVAWTWAQKQVPF